MVVIPREHDVSLTYGLTPVDWLGRIITLAGIIGLVALARWKGAARYGAFTAGATGDDVASDRVPPSTPGVSPDGDDPPPSRPPEPAPALP